MISICIPVHEMKHGDFFLKRALKSIEEQTYKDYEVVITNEGKMAENTNRAIKKAKGDIIKVLFMDDYLAHGGTLQVIADNFKTGWLATGCKHDDGRAVYNPHLPIWNDLIYIGENTIGSPSVIAFENKKPLLFDEKLSWMIDCEYYMRMYEKYGLPTLVDDYGIIIGIGDHQTSYLMSEEDKAKEQMYAIHKYEKRNLQD